MNFHGVKSIWATVDDMPTPYTQGGNSYIYIVKDNGSSLCAAKLFKHDLSGERFNRFLDEIEIVKKLNGLQGCVPYLDHGYVEERPFYIMPFYKHGTFRSRYLNGAQISIENKLSDFLRALRIVKSVHDIGLAIRDIKPQNILVNDAGLPLISDFGLSIWLDQSDEDRHTPSEGSVGSRGYRPPEWQSRYPNPNHKPGDIWSLGRTLWAIVAGRNPPDNYETLGGTETHLALYIDKSFANMVQSLVTACTHQDHTQRPSIEELISLSEEVFELIKQKNISSEGEQIPSLQEVIKRFNTQVINSSVYIDSQLMESAKNIQLREVEDAELLLIEVLQKHSSILNDTLPKDLGSTRVLSNFNGTSFLSRQDLSTEVCENDHWGRIVMLRFDPSDTIRRHKNIDYSGIYFYIGIGKTNNFYWIVQLHDQSLATRGSHIIEQIAPKALGTVTSQKVSQMEEFLKVHFLPQIERHFTS